MKKEKGDVFLQLIIYLACATVFILAIASATAMFLRYEVKIQARCEIERDCVTFNRFFLDDMKQNDNDQYTVIVTDNAITFPDGDTYLYVDQKVTRNGTVIVNNAQEFNFAFTEPKTVTVHMVLTKQNLTEQSDNIYVFGRGY